MANLSDVAKALTGLSWSDMNEFAVRITEIATDDNKAPNDEHYIACALIDWADEQTETAQHAERNGHDG